MQLRHRATVLRRYHLVETKHPSELALEPRPSIAHRRKRVPGSCLRTEQGGEGGMGGIINKESDRRRIYRQRGVIHESYSRHVLRVLRFFVMSLFS